MKKRTFILFLLATFQLSANNNPVIETVFPGIYKISVGQVDRHTPFSICETPPKAKVLATFETSNDYLKPAQIKMETNERGCIVEIPLQSDEQLYGFGLQIGSFMQNGLRKQPIVNDHPLNNLGFTHAPQTFYVSNKGYGILVNTSRYTTFYGGTLQLKKKSKNEIKKTDSMIATTTEALYASESSGSNMLVDIPGASGIEVFLICGSDLKEVIEKYNLLSGGGALPPMWGMGVKYRMKGDSDANDVKKMATYFREKQIPCDVLGLEPGWQTKAYSCSYVWEKKRFPDPETMIKQLNNQSFKVNLWEHAFVNPESPIHDTLMNYSGDYQVWNGLVPDFLTKEGRSIFKEYHKKYLAEKGISGFKLDECDNSDLAFGSGSWSFPGHSKFPSGVDGEQMHQLFGSLYLNTMNSIYKDMNKRTYSDYRSGNIFLSAIPATLYSDIYGHRDYIQMISNSGFGGLLWSPELRESSTDIEMIQRLQTLLMSSQVVLNCWYLQYPPWLQYDKEKNNKGEFLSNANELEQQVRKLLNERMSLIPYLYTAFANYHFAGTPPFRALVVDYPQDEKVFRLDDQFLIGGDLMAAPFYDQAKQRQVYFPEGVWYDFTTNRKYEGGQSFTIDYVPEKLPLFVKEHAIIPVANPVPFVNNETVFVIECRVYGDGKATTTLYEDDGESYDFELGQFQWNQLFWDGKKGKISKNGHSSLNRYTIKSWKVIR